MSRKVCVQGASNNDTGSHLWFLSCRKAQIRFLQKKTATFDQQLMSLSHFLYWLVNNSIPTSFHSKSYEANIGNMEFR